MKDKKRYRIGIDTRMAGEGFGIGRYIEQLAQHLINQDERFEYIMFFHDKSSRASYEKFSKLVRDCRLVSCRYYTASEQLKMPYYLIREKLDLVHFPNFNAPVLYPGKFIVTIHDLIHHQFPGRKKRNILYRIGYRVNILMAAQRAVRVIAVSQTTKRDIISLLKVPSQKISVVYEGVAEAFRRPVSDQIVKRVKGKFGIHRPFLLSVGVWRRYKNQLFLVEAFKRLGRKDLQLVLVGEKDRHYPELFASVVKEKNIITTGKIPDEELAALYQNALCYIAPSLSEGFGLPSLEAQSSGCPVLSSHIPAALELLGDSARYFDPRNLTSLTALFKKIVADDNLRSQLASAGKANSSRYTWEETARQTLQIYQNILLHDNLAN